jgi:hypothetical protein
VRKPGQRQGEAPLAAPDLDRQQVGGHEDDVQPERCDAVRWPALLFDLRAPALMLAPDQLRLRLQRSPSIRIGRAHAAIDRLESGCVVGVDLLQLAEERTLGLQRQRSHPHGGARLQLSLDGRQSALQVAGQRQVSMTAV